jgi:gliding motility-associated-like protein
MKRTLRTFLLVCCMPVFTAQATHMSGGEIYWDCIGPNQYRITLTIYRDCAGIQLDNNYDLAITSPCGTTSLQVSTPGGTELSQLCGQQLSNSTCNGGSLPGIQQYVYTGIITLPPCDSWTISWTEIYRNNAIVNLQAPGTLEMYIQAELNNADAPCNDSPVFTNTAIPYICLGYPVSYSYGAYDPEGDSLSYQLIGARVGGANPINYVPPFSGSSPISGITMDPQTGLVEFTLNTAGNWVVVVQVNEYDSLGNLIGTVMRDMQFIAYPCTNVPPDPTTGTVTGMSGQAVQTAPYAVQVCESGAFCFDMVISDANTNNVLEATSNVANNLPGATFTYSGTNPITCHVCWSAGQGTSGFYPFIVNVNDGACPIVAFQTYVYSITVIDGIFIDVTSTNESCAGANNGTGTVTVTDGTGPFQYNWATTGATTPTITAGAGIYPVQVTDANGCVSAPANAVITAPLPPTANAGPDLTACYGTWPIAVQGSTSNATSSTWSGGGGSWTGAFPNLSYTPSAAEIAAGAANLTLTAGSGNNCPQATDAMQMAISNSFINAAIGASNATCNGVPNGSATVTPNSTQLTYLWSPGGQTSATATGLAAGNYSVLISDQLNCTTTLNTVVAQPTALTIGNVQVTNETCAGAANGTISATVSGGTAPYQYSWSNGATGPTLTAGSGTYTLTVTDANGCAPATATATIQNGGQPNIAQAGPDQFVCMGDYPLNLQGAVTNATGGVWSGGAGSFNGGGLNAGYTPTAAEIAAGGVYLVLTTTGNSNCPADADTVHISLSNSFQNASISGTGALCASGNTGTATFSPSLPGLSYLWQPSGQTTPTAINLAGGPHSVTVTDGMGCDTTLSVTIAQPPALAITNVQAMDPTCANDANGSASATVSGGTPGYSYQWSANTGGQTTPMATGLGTGNYVVVVTDANGCTAQGSAIITAPPAISLVAQVPDTVCVNAPVQLTAQASGGDGNLTINWAGIGMGTSLVYSFPTSQTVLVSVTDASGCSGPTLAMPVHVLDLSNAALVAYGDTTVCAGGIASVGAEVTGYAGALSYNWPELGTVGTGPHNVPVNQSQILHVTATNSCGQSLQDAVDLVLEIPPTIILPDVMGIGCAPLTVEFPDSLTTANVTWLWDLGDGTTSTAPAPTHTYSAGSYTIGLVVTTPAGCSAAAANSSSVTAYEGPVAGFTASTYSTDMSQPMVEFTDGSTGAINAYSWTFGDGGTSADQSPSYTYTDVGTFDVVLEVTDINGCTASATQQVELLPVYDIVIPNGFTPNPSGGNGGAYDPNDLSNDVFYPFVRFVKEYRMRIWNRWGELVFESDDVRRGWDGFYRGQLSQQDVYVYRMEIRFVDDRTAERSGDITLFR